MGGDEGVREGLSIKLRWLRSDLVMGQTNIGIEESNDF